MVSDLYCSGVRVGEIDRSAAYVQRLIFCHEKCCLSMWRMSVSSGLVGKSPIYRGGKHMAINLVTHRKGGKTEEVIAAAKQSRAFVMKHGAEDLQLSTEIAGPDAGQWVLVIRCKDWESYGRAFGGATANSQFSAILGALDKVAEVTSRRLVLV